MNKKKIAIINGVNLNALGSREVNIYGHVDFNSYFTELKTAFPACELSYFQSNKIDEIIEQLYQYQHFDAIILNPGAYTHTSIILADAIKAIQAPVIEVHISNLFGREQFRKNSLIAAACQGSISGFGLSGYQMAIFSLLNHPL
ncbi:MAG: 3-dehydroquinate dehydratase [Bacteroidales bacterium]|jgi:3-dehydroquinate dehydratase-2|nr:3-dehydroquinate dehydratase [Bacteroidales bacterium]